MCVVGVSLGHWMRVERWKKRSGYSIFPPCHRLLLTYYSRDGNLQHLNTSKAPRVWEGGLRRMLNQWMQPCAAAPRAISRLPVLSNRGPDIAG